MIARFFVDRPIFATVISVVFVLAGGVAVFTLPMAQYPEVTPPTVLVTAIYPGANAKTVRDTVAAPIEEQVSGVEGMLYMTSRCTNDGAYNLTVTFRLGMDSDMAQVLVQNRVSLALPVIPALVQNEGINVRKMSPNTLMIVNLISPDNRYNDIHLSNYATIDVTDELGRLPGVAGITYLGQRDYSLRVWLDPGKMAAVNLSSTDVVTAITQQNVQVPAGQIGQQPVPRGQQFQLTLNTLGRLTDPDQFADVILKAGTATTVAQPAAAASDGIAIDGASADAQTVSVSQTTGIVRLRDVVRDNKYVVRIQLDPARLAQRNLKPSDVVQQLHALAGRPNKEARRTGRDAFQGLMLRPRSLRQDGPAKMPGELALNWLATYGGPEPPREADVADTKIQGAESTVRLGDLVIPETGIEHLEQRDELGVQLGSQQYDQSCTLDGRPSVALSIYQLPGSNALETARLVYAKMKELKTRFPDGLDYKIVYDTTPFIRESVWEVFHTLRDAVILVAIVVLVFLQDWRAMILPMIDVPVSLIGTFAVMAAMGFTLNNLTLFGLVLAIGIVVDDAIVVLENIERQLATGLDARTATIKAMEEITGPVLAITLVLASVFIPCCFLGGVSGQFFRQFAVTIAVSTIISAVNALTMTPSRAVVIFKTEPGQSHEHKREALPWWFFGLLGGLLTLWLMPKLFGAALALPAETGAEGDVEVPAWLRWAVNRAGEVPAWLPWALNTAYFTPGALVGGFLGRMTIRPVNAAVGSLFAGFNRAFDAMTAVYGRFVGRTLRFSAIVLFIYGGLLCLTYWKFTTAPTGFIPQQDKGYLILNVQLPDSASVERTRKIMSEIEAIALDTPGVKHTVGISGTSLILSANAPNLGSLYVLLNEFEHRHGTDLSAEAIAADLQRRFRKEVREAVVSTFMAPPIDGLGKTGGFKLIIEDRGNLGLDELQKVSDRIVAKGNKKPELQGLFSGAQANTPWLYLEIDRTKCQALGVQVSDVFNSLQVYLGSFYVNNFNQFGRTWQVNVQADPSFRSKVSDIRQLPLRNRQGQMIRLGTVMDVRDVAGPVMVMRYNMYSAVAITGEAAPGTSSGEAVALMEEVARQEMPRAMAPEWTELAFLQLEAGNTATWFFLLAVVFVFLVLAAQYESWKLPMAVILVVPMCLLCSLIGVGIAHMEVTLFTQIGFVVLVGLASKNAILIVEFAKQQQEAGVPLRQATMEACRLRLRPILMTSFAFIFGVVPLVIAEGAGAEMRRSLGTAVFSGMLGVTLFGVVLTPVFYYVIQRYGERRTAAQSTISFIPATLGLDVQQKVVEPAATVAIALHLERRSSELDGDLWFEQANGHNTFHRVGHSVTVHYQGPAADSLQLCMDAPATAGDYRLAFYRRGQPIPSATDSIVVKKMPDASGESSNGSHGTNAMP